MTEQTSTESRMLRVVESGADVASAERGADRASSARDLVRVRRGGDRLAVASLPANQQIKSLFVTVGRLDQPFDRLISGVERWALSRGQVSKALLHAGSSAAPDHVRYWARIAHRDMRERLASAEIVVVPAETSLLLTCRDLGRRPIVAPRRPELGEARDDREVRLAQRLAADGVVDLALTLNGLHAALDDALADAQPACWAPAGDAEVAEVVGAWAERAIASKRWKRRSR